MTQRTQTRLAVRQPGRFHGKAAFVTRGDREAGAAA